MLTKSDIIQLLLTNETTSVTQLEELADLILGENLLIGTITSEMINAAPAALSIDFNYPGAKPAGKNVIGGFLKCFTPIISASGVVVDTTLTVTGYSFKLDRIPMPDQVNLVVGENFALSESRQQDSTMTLQFTHPGDVVNPKDFLPGGVFKFYFQLKDIPVLK